VSVPGRGDIFVVTDAGVDSIKIIKGIKAVEG
jgi:WD40 repeat protein